MDYTSLSEHVSSSTMRGIESFGFTSLTDIQSQAIPHLLEGRDLRGTAKTGSGKTLAFLIPAIEMLHKTQFKTKKGVGVLILAPTRELSRQIFEVAQKLTEHHPYTCGLITGGKDKKGEAQMLAEGITILVATPGRLMHHLDNTPAFKCNRTKCLVLDEADKMLDTGFAEQVKVILRAVQDRKQTMLFSATKTPKTNELVKVVLREDFIDIDVTSGEELVTADGLNQSYVVIATENKLLFLKELIVNYGQKEKKVMVFFNCCTVVKFYRDLFKCCSIPVLGIHGNMDQSERTDAFDKFKRKRNITLLCTDVAARGWDIPEVDIVIQFDPPRDVSDYIHRVGRTARADKEGQALLLLREEEEAFVPLLENRRIKIPKMAFDESLLPKKHQQMICDLVEGNEYLKYWAKQAFKKHLESYAMSKLSDVFDVYEIDLKELLQTFGLQYDSIPDLDFDLLRRKRKRQNKEEKVKKNKTD